MNRTLSKRTFATLALSLAASALTLSVASSALAQASPVKAQKTAKASAADPLAGDNWHAVTPSWPGTIRFDAKARTVRLEPLGSNPIDASYTLSEVKTAGTTTTGKLLMTSSAGALSESTFAIEKNKNLTLKFTNGPGVETYVRLSPAEAEREKQKLLDAIRKGTLTPIGGAAPDK